MKYDKDYTKEELLSSGVYCIENIINNKKYIGSSANLRNRRNNHSLQLRKGNHCNQILQKAVFKYGFKNFRFKILEFCDQEKLIKVEQRYLDIQEPEYNIQKNATDTYIRRNNIKLNKESLREARAEYITYIWDTKTDKQYVVGNVVNKTHSSLHAFCKEFDLTKESIRTAFNKNKNNYKQFVIYRERKENQQPSTSFLETYYNKHKDFKIRKQRKSPYIYTLISPSNKIYTISKDIKGFCETHSLDRSSVVKVAKGVLPHTKQWSVSRQLKS